VSPAHFTLRLAKSDFKFAASHFTWFPDGSAERLHGHNYQVSLWLSADTVGPSGMLIEARVVKDHVRRLCAALDERMLVPEPSERVAIEASSGELRVRCAGREYRLPTEDVVRLPVANITVECLARWIWGELATALGRLPAARLGVEVAESDGQSASYESELVGARSAP
jgi:6-pyruvoyltetrahydropterin/6-carboxytetrahydropterin synthase